MATSGIRKTFDGSFEEALVRVPEALKSEGFGVLSDIDIQATLKAKLGVDFRRYRILGACNPPLAHSALQTELEIGLMLPCNVIVYERDDGGVEVVAVDPTKTIAATGDDRLVELAGTVKEKLSQALSKLG